MASTTPVTTPSMGRAADAPVLLREDISTLQLAYDSDDEVLDATGKKQKLAMQKLLWAFHLIQTGDTKTWNSFFRIAGFHGMPFRGAGWGNPSWWGGYCNHGNVLFPTWHRAYLVRLENALRAVTGYDDITLPYWNETGDSARMSGIPSIFLREDVTIPYSVAKQNKDGSKTIPNPLRSYKFQDGIWDNLNPVPDADYSKPKGYETTRYPFSGLVGSDDVGATKQHNWLIAQLPDTDKLLNDNVKNWLGSHFINSDGVKIQTNTYSKYRQALNAPNYTVFSNTTSATQYNEDVYYNTPGNTITEQDVPPKKPRLPVVSLESPHNDMHLAIGGFDIPGQFNVDAIIGSNGDMGENDTAAFDPIFYFHHCFIDKVFWDWQRKWDSRTKLTIDKGYPGTNSVDYQGPTPGVAGNTWLTMESPLAPFTVDDTENGKSLTSNDIVDIVGQLRYKYYADDYNDTDSQSSGSNGGGSDGGQSGGSGSGGGSGGGRGCSGGTSGDCCHGSCCRRCKCSCGLGKGCGCGCQSCRKLLSQGDEISQLLRLPLPGHGPADSKLPAEGEEPQSPPAVHVVRVSGVDRANMAGSFVLTVRAVVNGTDSVVGTESVLSRWKVSGCANCQKHLGVKAFIPLVGLNSEALSTVRVGLHARGKVVGDINNDHSTKGGWRVGHFEMPHGMDLPIRD